MELSILILRHAQLKFTSCQHGKIHLHGSAHKDDPVNTGFTGSWIPTHSHSASAAHLSPAQSTSTPDAAHTLTPPQTHPLSIIPSTTALWVHQHLFILRPLTSTYFQLSSPKILCPPALSIAYHDLHTFPTSRRPFHALYFYWESSKQPTLALQFPQILKYCHSHCSA